MVVVANFKSSFTHSVRTVRAVVDTDRNVTLTDSFANVVDTYMFPLKHRMSVVSSFFRFIRTTNQSEMVENLWFLMEKSNMFDVLVD